MRCEWLGSTPTRGTSSLSPHAETVLRNTTVPITNTSSIPLVDSTTSARPRRGVWRDQGVQLFGIILGPSSHLSGTPTRGQCPTPPRPHSPPPPGSPSPSAPHTHPATSLPPPAPRGPSPLPASSFASSRAAQRGSGARERRADGSLGGRRAHLHCVAEPLAHSVVEGLNMSPSQFLQRWLLLFPRDPVRRVS